LEENEIGVEKHLNKVAGYLWCLTFVGTTVIEIGVGRMLSEV